MDQTSKDMRIDIMEDGPYMVSGSVPLLRMEIVCDERGDSVSWRETYRYPTQETYMLCRCGKSSDMPYCDGSHLASGFSGNSVESKATHFADELTTYSGDGIQLLDAGTYCIGARFCDRGGSVWALTKASGRNQRYKDLAIEESQLCPSGRLLMYDLETKDLLEPELEPSIALIQDPARQASCAIWVRGQIPIFGSDGKQFEPRNRVTLCRCGQSTNKPFCDGRHYMIGFDDGFDA